MAADTKVAKKSRKERRKEARVEKGQRKFNSWVHHQQSRKLKKFSSNPKSKDVKIPPKSNQISEEKEIIDKGSFNGTDGSLEQLTKVENPDVQSEALGLGNSNAFEGKKNKCSNRKAKTKFEKYLHEDLKLEDEVGVNNKKIQGTTPAIDMFDEGIPSIHDSLEREHNTEEEETFRTNDPSVKKRKKRKSSEEKRKGETASSSASKVSKRKKTKFEEYIEMDMKGGGISAEDDFALERKLAKKLKVKGGIFRTNDDDINMLFEGIPSVLDSLNTEEEAPMTTIKSSSAHKKRKMKLKEQETDAGIEGDTSVGVSEPLTSPSADVAFDKCPPNVDVMRGNAKYVPPQQRSLSKNQSEEHSHVRKQIRGLLNKLSESNIESIASEMSTIFHSIGRSIGAQIVGEEVLSSCSGGPRGNEQYAAVFAALIAGMTCLVGMDFGAKLMASLAKIFEDEYLKEDNLSLRNLTLLLSYLYIFGVCSSDLIYDFMLMLSKRLTEVDVSTVLTILQCCGMKLRSDDPSAMKNFIFSVQNRVTELKADLGNDQEKMRSKRMEFMLETICDIKNNKRRPKEDTPQHVRIKKWLQKLNVGGILIRGLSWSKLLDPNKKGQWWLFGDVTSTKDNTEEVASKIDREVPEAQKMMQLAATQRMNTDARRAIFCIIMSGEDYVDAFEKLLRVDLHGKQDREIMRVLLECCLQEKVFNKYYCILASKLCSHDKNHKFTLQYCVWDHFKELESMPLIRSMHLSKFVAEMLASFSLSLAVVKVVDLNDVTQLTSKKIMHFRMLFEAIFEFSDKMVWNIFTRIAGAPEYEELRDGIKFFITEYVVSGQKSLAGKFKVAKKALNNLEGVIM